MNEGPGRVLDELAKLMNDGAGVAQGLKKEAQTAVRSQVEHFIGDMDLVRREDFEVVREMATRAREENEKLAKEIADLKAQLAKKK